MLKHKISSVKSSIFLNLKNIPGWRTSRKILVIECDDWGGIRMPSKNVYNQLLSVGLNVKTGRFNKYDTIETEEDLIQLFYVLTSVRDQNSKPAVMTPFTIVANPDFEKIKTGGFNEYYYERFPNTLNKYYPEQNVFKIWQEGIEAGIFLPELHGRDHTSVYLWMKKLKEGNRELISAFEHGFVSLDVQDIPSQVRDFRAEFYFASDKEKSFLVGTINDSINIFNQIFGHQPIAFAPANGIFPRDFDNILDSAGIRFLNVSRSSPYPAGGGEIKYRYFITGQKGPGKLTYYVRNCVFEPTETDYRGIEPTLKQINAAFRWGKPAIVSTHRVNYTGGIDPTNRTQGLTELKKLLKAAVKMWPEIEFLSSGDALQIMRDQ